MSVERVGLVSRVEKDLERVIALGLLPRDGSLPSEELLARQQGVSRMTAREALLRLAARGLVVHHPGRRSRAVPLLQAVTLENLSVALHAEGPGHSDGRRLLEGYFTLKRDTTVELLAACCEHASQEELSQLAAAGFALGDTLPWEPQSRWAEREFELLRLAALTAHRPGHFLLVQSLERSFWAMAGRLLPHMDREAIRQWARRAVSLLDDKDAQALRRQLPALLQASDEQLLKCLAPNPVADNPSGSQSTTVPRPGEDSLDRSACHTGSDQAPSAEASQLELEPGAVQPDRSACPTASGQSHSTVSLMQETEAGKGGAVMSNRSSCHTGLSHEPLTDAPLLESEEGRVGTDSVNRSACHTGSSHTPPTETPEPEPEPGAVLPNPSACPTASARVLSTDRPLPEVQGGGVGADSPNQYGCHTGSSQAPPTETPLPGGKVGTASINRAACHTGVGDGLSTEALLPVHEGRGPGPVSSEGSGCHTGSRQAPPTRASPRALPSRGSDQPSSRMWSPVPWARAPSPARAGLAQALAALRAESSLVTTARSLSRCGSSNSSESGSNWKSACLSFSSACIAASPDWPA